MTSSYHDTVFDFDLNLLNQTANVASIQEKFDSNKQKKSVAIVKKKIIATDSLIAKYYGKRVSSEEMEKALMAYKEECRQTLIQYRDVLESYNQVQLDYQKLQNEHAICADNLMAAKNQTEASQSHAHQLQVLLKQKEIESARVEKNSKKPSVKNCDKKEFEQKVESLKKDLFLFINLVKKQAKQTKRPLKPKYVSLIRIYETSQDGKDHDYSDAEDDIFEDVMLSPPANTNMVKKCSVSTKDMVPMECDSDYSNEVVSIDTGRGSSLAFSDNEKCINSPDYSINNSPLNGETILTKARPKVVSVATSPIMFEDCELSSNLPSISEIHPKSGTINMSVSPIKLKKSVFTSPIRKVTREMATSTDKISVTVGTSPIKILTREMATSTNLAHNTVSTSPMRKATREIAVNTDGINDKLSNSQSKKISREIATNTDRVPDKVPTSGNKKVTKEVATSTDEINNTVTTSPIKKITREIATNTDNINKIVSTSPLMKVTREISTSTYDIRDKATTSCNVGAQDARAKECLELNNSNNLSHDNNTDYEIEMILNAMKLNYRTISPIPRTPSRMRTEAPNMLSDHNEHVKTCKYCKSAQNIRVQKFYELKAQFLNLEPLILNNNIISNDSTDILCSENNLRGSQNIIPEESIEEINNSNDYQMDVANSDPQLLLEESNTPLIQTTTDNLNNVNSNHSTAIVYTENNVRGSQNVISEESTEEIQHNSDYKQMDLSNSDAVLLPGESNTAIMDTDTDYMNTINSSDRTEMEYSENNVAGSQNVISEESTEEKHQNDNCDQIVASKSDLMLLPDESNIPVININTENFNNKHDENSFADTAISRLRDQEAQDLVTVNQSPKQPVTVNQSPTQPVTVTRNPKQLVTVNQSPKQSVNVNQKAKQPVTLNQSSKELVIDNQSPIQPVTVNQIAKEIVTVKQSSKELVTDSQSPKQPVIVSQMAIETVTVKQSSKELVTDSQSLKQPVTVNQIAKQPVTVNQSAKELVTLNHSPDQLVTVIQIRDGELSTDSDKDSPNDSVVKNQTPTKTSNRKKVKRKKTRLDKLRKSLKPKYKIRSETPPLSKSRLKRTKLSVSPNKVSESTSASLNNKDAYEKAVKVMAEINSQKSLALSQKSPIQLTKHLSPIHKTQMDEHMHCSDNNKVTSPDSLVTTRSKRQYVERQCSVILEKSPLVAVALENENIETQKEIQIKTTNETTPRKRTRHPSFESEVPTKRVLRSATTSQRLSTENKPEIVNAISNQCRKSIEASNANEINNTPLRDVPDVRSPKRVVPPKRHQFNQQHNTFKSYEDLDIFSENVQPEKEATPRSTCLSGHPKESILCTMLLRYGSETGRKHPKTVPEANLKTICEKFEQEIPKIIMLPINERKSPMIRFAADLQKLKCKHMITGLIMYLSKPERKLELFGKIKSSYSPPMTEYEQILLFLIRHLKNHWSSVDLVDAVLSSIEYSIFKLNRTPEFDVIESTSHFYALLCRYHGAMSRLRIFMLDALYCIQFKAIPLIKQCLDVWMHIIPLAHMRNAKTPLVMCLVYLLHFYKCDDKFNRVLEIRNILSRKYFYQISDWNERKIIEVFKQAILDVNENPIEKKMLRMALIILAKRQGPQWCQNHIMKNLLVQLIEKENVSSTVKEFCVCMIGPLMKPYPADMKVYCEIAFNQLTNILDNDPSQSMEEAAIRSMMLINRHNQHSINQLLLKRKMKPMSSELEEILRDYVKTKPLKVWLKMLPKISLN